MKLQNIFYRFSLLLLMMLISSCGQSTNNTRTFTTETPHRPTKSAIPITLPTATFLPASINTTIPTPTSISILPAAEAQTLLLERLADNGGCSLPCVWNIVPGESSFQEAREILAPLSEISYSVFLTPPGPGDIRLRYTENDMEISIRVAFLADPNKEIVNRIVLNAEAHKLMITGGYEDIFDSKLFSEKVSAYTLPHILSEHGIPSSVMIATYGGVLTRGSAGGFEVLLLYPNQGISVHYTTQMYLIGSSVKGCLDNAHVEMELSPSGNPDFFTSLKRSWYKPLDEVTTMSLIDFYETFRQQTNNCLETPANLWPVPEK
ncbi:MAG: hypothetical protein MUC85_05775 [Anaerolineales bacterium]|nr:hypothetical protein [Anaerolineales bacterium]